jgi:hypothetical protein
MVNTRNSQCNGQPSNNNNNNSNNNAKLAQLITTQNQLMQAVLQTLNNMQPNQQAHQQQAPPPPPPHQSHLAEFLRTRSTIFSQGKDPMEVEDWLKGVEKETRDRPMHGLREGPFFCAPALWDSSQLEGDVLQYPWNILTLEEI